MFNSIFVADESATVSEKSETTAWPVYPNENPTVTSVMTKMDNTLSLLGGQVDGVRSRMEQLEADNILLKTKLTEQGETFTKFPLALCNVLIELRKCSAKTEGFFSDRRRRERAGRRGGRRSTRTLATLRTRTCAPRR